MKRYAFSLDRVLRVRSAQESLNRQALRAAANRATQADHDYDYVERCYQASLASEAAMRGSVLAMLAMRDLDTIRARAVIDADATRVDAHAEMAAARAAWMQAKQRVTGLEQLNERQRADYERESIAEQDAESDDIVTGRHSVARAERLHALSPHERRSS